MGWSGRAPALPARQAGKGPCLIGMEACTGAHHLSRKLQALGHDARLMPTNYVRPYSKTRMTIATLKRSPKQCNVRR
jgi:transposase